MFIKKLKQFVRKAIKEIKKFFGLDKKKPIEQEEETEEEI